MGRLFFCRLLTVGLLLFGVVQAAQGVITALTPLGAYLSQSSYIILAKVEKFYPEKPAMMLTVEEDLKGKIPLRRLPVNVKLDPKAEKGNYVPEILKRIGPNQKIVLFVLSLEESLMVLGFSNGSWFQMSGQKVDEGKSVFTLTSGEPFLRRTFKGTTGEMRQLVKDCLAGKKKPPEPDAKEKSGFGPEVSAPKEKSSGITPWRAGGVSPPVTSSHPGHYHPGANAPRSLFGVIPTLGVGAPLAILALSCSQPSSAAC